MVAAIAAAREDSEVSGSASIPATGPAPRIPPITASSTTTETARTAQAERRPVRTAAIRSENRPTGPVWPSGPTGASGAPGPTGVPGAPGACPPVAAAGSPLRCRGRKGVEVGTVLPSDEDRWSRQGTGSRPSALHAMDDADARDQPFDGSLPRPHRLKYALATTSPPVSRP